MDTWKRINELLRKTKPKSTMPQKIIVRNETIVSPQTICDKINNHIVKIGENLSASLENNLRDKHCMKHLGKRNPSSLILRPTDEYEIIEINAKVNINNSPGLIDIPIVLFEEGKFLIARYLAESFNECLKTGHYGDVSKNRKGNFSS